MKKKILFLSPLFFLVTVLCLLHTSWLQEKLLSYIKISCKNRGWTVQIEGLTSSFPLDFSFQNISCLHEDGTYLSIQDSSIKVTLLKFGISSFHSATIDYHSFFSSKTTALPCSIRIYDFSIDRLTVVNLSSNFQTTLTCYGMLNIKHDFSKISGNFSIEELESKNKISAYLTSRKQEIQADIKLDLTEKTTFLFPLSLEATLSLGSSYKIQSFSLKNPQFLVTGSLSISKELIPTESNLFISYPFINFTSKLLLKQDHDKSICTLVGTIQNEPIDLQFSYSQAISGYEGSLCGALGPLTTSAHTFFNSNQIRLEDLSLTNPLFHLGGQGSFFWNNLEYRGFFALESEDLKILRPFFPSSHIQGQIGSLISLEGSQNACKIDSQINGNNLRYENLWIDAAIVTCKTDQNLMQFEADLKNTYLSGLFLSHVDVCLLEDQTFSLSLEGRWKEDLSLSIKGELTEFNTITINSCFGHFLQSSFYLDSPSTISWKQSSYYANVPSLTIDQGTFSAEITPTFYRIQGAHLPLNLFSFIYPKFSFQGLSSFQGEFSKIKNTGYFFLTLDEANLATLPARGSIQAHFHEHRAQIYAHLYSHSQQFIDFNATIPLHLFQIDHSLPISAELTAQGRLEEILSFLSRASYRVCGLVTTHMLMSGTFNKPLLEGSLTIQDGLYENYFSGTFLKEINAEAFAHQNLVELLSFQATDQKSGSVTATGWMSLEPQKSFPYLVQAHLESMKLAHFDPVEATGSGPILLKGDLKQASLSGAIDLINTEITIFDTLPVSIAVLPIQFINPPIYVAPSQFHPPFPLELNLQLSAKNEIVVKGRGVSSKWNGSVELKGSIESPIFQGALTLNKGDFLFSGKSFKLMQGEISFSEKNAYIKLLGELNLTKTTILVQMQGPLTSPHLTFQSLPTMPTSAILSFILFNKDISEITAIQALQLAQVIVSLSGNSGPGMLEAIRKKIGIDRWNIIEKDGTDEISVQIGWYLSHGVTISLSQSATSSDVIIEVDLKKGFIFQAETQNQEEGKFSLKWNKNY